MPKKNQLILAVGRTYFVDGKRGRLLRLHPLASDTQMEFLMLGGPRAGELVLHLRSKIKLQADRNYSPICRCQAYPFPHHRGMGKCEEEDEQEGEL